MVPRSQMQIVDLSESKDVWLPRMIEAGHSRFPVILDDDRDNVIGILHAKTILRVLIDPTFKAREHLRPAKFIPESMPLMIFCVTSNSSAIIWPLWSMSLAASPG